MEIGSGAPADDVTFDNKANAWEWVQQWLRSKERFLCVSASRSRFLTVDRNTRVAVAIEHDDSGNLYASSVPALSGTEVQFRCCCSDWVKLDRSMLITRRALRHVLRAYVLDEKLSEQVHWLMEEPKAS